MYQNYNRYSYVLNNPLKYTDPSGWVAMASRLTTVLLPEDYRNNIEGGYKSGGGGGYSDMSFDYNYAGPYSMYASNPAMYAFMYGTQTWMQTATATAAAAVRSALSSAYAMLSKSGTGTQHIRWQNNVGNAGEQKIKSLSYTWTFGDKSSNAYISNYNNYTNAIAQVGGGGGTYIPTRGFGLPFSPVQFGLPKPNINTEKLELGSSALDLSFGISTMLLGSRLNGSSFDYYRMNLGGQNIKTPTRIKFDRLTTLNKTLGRIATPFSIATTGYAGIKVWSKYNSGGNWSRADILNAIDFGIGFSGLGFSGLVWAGLITNPVGISIVGTGLLIYGGVRLGMDTYDYFNKP